MPVRNNGYFNDPAIGAAFGNLAQAFAPPTAQEIFAGAKAEETRQRMSQLAEMFAMGRDGNLTPEQMNAFNQGNIVLGNQTYATSKFGVDANNASSERRNAADNARALEQARLNNTKDVTVKLLDPVGAGSTRFVPPTIADQFRVDPTQTGVVNVAPGAQATLPDGRVIKGAPAAPNAAQLKNYRTNDGREGSAVYDPIVGWVDSQTRNPLPQGVRVYDATLRGSGSDIGLGPTTANTTAANNLAANLDAAESEATAYLDLLKNNPGIAGVPGNIRGVVQDAGSTIAEISSAFGDLAPDAKITLGDVQDLTRRIAPNRDPNIQAARLMESNLAYRYAQMNNPSGEVSRQAYERAFESLFGGALRNNKSSEEGITTFLNQIRRTRDSQLRALRAPTNTPPAAVPAMSGAPNAAPSNTPAPAERWERDPQTGQLRRVQ